jgi:hypothetical protein
VGDMRNIFENQSTFFNEMDTKNKNGKNNKGVKKGDVVFC